MIGACDCDVGAYGCEGEVIGADAGDGPTDVLLFAEGDPYMLVRAGGA